MHERFWIELPADDATPDLERMTRTYARQGRPVPGIIAVMKPSVKTMKAVLRLNEAVTFGGSGLGRAREELIAASTSALNDCFYWTVAHAGFLRDHHDGPVDDVITVIRALVEAGERFALHPLAEGLELVFQAVDEALATATSLAGRRELLRYTVRLAIAPRTMRAVHLEPLRQEGYSDLDLHDVVNVVACFSYMNRLADGLGVEQTAEPGSWAERLMGVDRVAAHKAWAAGS